MGTPRGLEIPRSERFLEEDKGIKRVPTPSEVVRKLNAMLPTPKQRDYKGQTQRGEDAPMDGMQNALDAQTGMNPGTRLRLEPALVEWMMGFPQNWTDLNCPNQDTE